SDATGFYTASFVVSPGAYELRFDILPLSYTTVWYNNKPSQAAADVLNVTTTMLVPNVNLNFTRLGAIVGQVTPPAAVPMLAVRLYGALSFSCIAATDSSCPSTGTIDASGRYTFTQLLPGSYKLEFATGSGSPYLSEFNSDKASWELADPVTISGGETIAVNA